MQGNLKCWHIGKHICGCMFTPTWANRHIFIYCSIGVRSTTAARNIVHKRG